MPADPTRDDPGARPLVSVIIPAYNVADYVGAAIESALAQTYPRVEVVVVDDGSTDATAAAIEPYRSRIVFVQQENAGLGAARNSAMRAASGDLFALLDADDLWLPERLERLVPVLEARPEVGMVTSDSFVMDDFEPTERRSYPDRRRRPFPAREADQIPEIARFNFLFVCVVFRRSLTERCGMFAEGPRRGGPDAAPVGGPPSVEGAEDYDLWTRFLISGARAAFVDEPLGYYRVRPGSLSQARKAQARAHLAVLERHLPALWRQGARGYARDAYAIGASLAARGDRRAAAQFLYHAVRGEEPRESRLRLALSCVRSLVRPATTWVDER